MKDRGEYKFDLFSVGKFSVAKAEQSEENGNNIIVAILNEQIQILTF